MTEHVLKCVQPYFDALFDGSKPFDVRVNDRAYQRGDTVVLQEYRPDGHPTCMPENCNDAAFTGRKVHAEVTFVYAGDLRFPGITPGYVVLGFGSLVREPVPA